MSKLNKDILYLIFEELGKDSKSLFLCLMVNKTWCETVIPILWRNPWCYDINYDNKSYLFAIIAYYLTDDIKEFLKIQRGLPQISCQSLLFDYLSYCRSININIINKIISNGSFLAYNQFLLQQEFYNLFMKKSTEFRYLDMRSIKHQIFFQYVDCFEHILLQKVLQKLYKLKTLIINDVFIFFSDEQLKTFSYRELEILNIDCITLNTASSIIENTGGQLKEILSSKYYDTIYHDDFDEDSLNFIRKVYENCPKIEYLSLIFSSSVEHFNELEKLLKVCKNLKSLLLVIFYEKEPEDELLEIIIRSAPNNLSEIRFFDDIQFTLEELETFFDKWKGRPALSMFTSDSIYGEKEYVALIDRYKNDGVIKYFSYEKNIYFNMETETD